MNKLLNPVFPAIFLLLSGSSCDLGIGTRSSGDTSENQEIGADAQVNQPQTEIRAGDDATVNQDFTPDNSSVVEASEESGGLEDLNSCAANSLYKPVCNSNDGVCILFAENCPEFVEVCLNLVSEPDEILLEECAQVPTSVMDGVTKYSFTRQGDEYTGEINALDSDGIRYQFFVLDPTIRNEGLELGEVIADEDLPEEEEEPAADVLPPTIAPI